MNQSLKSRYLIKLLSTIISGLINAVIIAIVPQALGAVAYGKFVYLQDFFIKAVGFLDMGSSIAFFTKLSADNRRRELILFYFSYLAFIFILLILFIYILDITDYIYLLIPNISTKYIYFGLLFATLTWASQIFIKISDAFALTISVEIIKILHKIASLGLILYFIHIIGLSLDNYFYFHYISLISFLIILSWLFWKKDIFKNLKFSDFYSKFSSLLKEFIEYCHPLVLYSIVLSLVGIFDIWLLQSVAGSREMGFYGVAYSLSAMAFLFSSAMTPIITREYSKFYGNGDIKSIRKLFLKYIPMLYSISAFFSIFISLHSQTILDIFISSDEFKEAYLVLVIMFFYPIHQTYGQLSGGLFYATGETKLLRNISLFIAPFSILVSIILIFFLKLGAIGLALKMVIVQFIGVNIQLYFNTKFLNLDFKYFLKHQLISILFFTAIGFLSYGVSNFILSGTIYTLWVIIFSYIFPQIFATSREEIETIFLRLKNAIKRKIKE
jgi:O-antigen/teichoic acid export membrane protein